MYTYYRPELEETGGFTGYMVDETATIKSFDYSSVYRAKEFTEAMKYFDTSDTMTRSILLAVNEADQGTVMTSLSNKLYKHIVDKVDDIDFGTIPESRGDITKIDNYENLVDCINIISEILQQYHQPTDTVEIVRREANKNDKLSGIVSLIDSFKEKMSKLVFLGTFDKVSSIKLGK